MELKMAFLPYFFFNPDVLFFNIILNAVWNWTNTKMITNNSRIIVKLLFSFLAGKKNIWKIFFILHIFFQELKSPNYPYDYPGGLECLYILKAQGKGKIISLEILDLDMEPEKDFVLIRDGPTANDRELARLTGSKSEYSFIR